MGNGLLLSPHADDESLFAAYTLLRHKPKVVICFSGALRHGPRDLRLAEAGAAMDVLGCDWHALPDGCEPRFELERENPEWVWAPLPEQYGHSAHNRIGQLAADLWSDRLTYYTTYSMPPGRTTIRTIAGTRVVEAPGWPALKREALACYRSQIAHRGTSVHFERDLSEYIVDFEDFADQEVIAA